LHARNLEQNLLFSILILGSVFGDYVVFYGDRYISETVQDKDILTMEG